MSPRSVEEWIGKTPDTAIPPRVRIRVFDRAGKRCEECSRPLFGGDKWQADHTVAIINGGENRERNPRCVCDWCHKAKTAADVGEKSRIAAKRVKHLGQHKSRRPMDGSRASPWKRPINGPAERRSP